jgi:hypothetical protein
MTILEQQFQDLAEKFSGARCDLIAGGSFAITVPNFPLPNGWTSKFTTVRFIAPVGFPQGRPDCFWTDHDLKLEGNRVPQNTGMNPMPNVPGQFLWFSWHVQNWSPNSDTLLTYLRVIEKRFRQLQ